MEYLLITLKTIGAYLILLFIGTNLIGGVVRGFLVAGTVNTNQQAKEIYGRAGGTVTVIFILLLLGYLYVLYYFFNIWVVIAAIVLIIVRMPDLIWEIRNGQKITLRTMPKNLSGIILNILSWAVLPLLWYSFYIS
jgi:hypothetical protein